MLSKISINNIALIDFLELDFRSGFNVLTGETGAGKSIIIDAVNFVLGERANRDILKFGADKAKVEAVFSVSENEALEAVLNAQEIETDCGELVLARELSASGKNVCRVNGTLVSLSVIKQISDVLVDIHGQHQHQSLLQPENHVKYLDAFEPAKSRELTDELAALCAEHSRLTLEKNGGFGTEAERSREADMLAYQCDEIENAGLTIGEDDALNAEKAILLNAEKIRSAIERAYNMLFGGDESNALSLIDGARRELRDISAFSNDFAAMESQMDDSYYGIEEAAYALRDKLDGLEFNEERLNCIENRLELISSLKRKYGNTVEEILEYFENAKKRLSMLNSAEERSKEIGAQIEAIENKYRKIDSALSELRKASAVAMNKAVLGHMADMGLDKADFDVSYSVSDAMRSEGSLNAEFMLTANPGSPLMPLAKVASGGELSRIMLCFKAIFADNDKIDTLIFDEIDTGISGRVAAAVGRKMKAIAKSHQVICITHLPQIAALADAHFAVEKHDDGKSTTVDAVLLDDEGKYRRLAQMMDGDPNSEYAYEHAKQLVERG